MAVPEAAVAVIRHLFVIAVLSMAYIAAEPAAAAVLADERIDVTYKSYEGGGTEVTGPAVLVRKNFGSSVSTWARYYEVWSQAHLLMSRPPPAPLKKNERNTQ